MRTTHFSGRPSLYISALYCVESAFSFRQTTALYGPKNARAPTCWRRTALFVPATLRRRLLATCGRRGHMTTPTTDGRTKRRKMANEKTSGRLNEMDVSESVTVDAAAAAAVSLPQLFVWRRGFELLID